MPVTLADYLPLDHVQTGLSATTRDGVLQALVSRLASAGSVGDEGRVMDAVLAREGTLSTGVGEGVALPHARTKSVADTVMALATLATPVDWDAIDGEPVNLVLLMVGPETARGEHVRLLARVSRALSTDGVRARLAAAATPQALVHAIAHARR